MCLPNYFYLLFFPIILSISLPIVDFVLPCYTNSTSTRNSIQPYSRFIHFFFAKFLGFSSYPLLYKALCKFGTFFHQYLFDCILSSSTIHGTCVQTIINEIPLFFHQCVWSLNTSYGFVIEDHSLCNSVIIFNIRLVFSPYDLTCILRNAIFLSNSHIVMLCHNIVITFKKKVYL